MLVLNTNIIRRDDERGKGIGQMCQAIQDSVLLFLCGEYSFAFGSRDSWSTKWREYTSRSNHKIAYKEINIKKFPDDL